MYQCILVLLELKISIVKTIRNQGYVRLDFIEHLDGIIKKYRRKINAISRTTSFMNISKRRILMNSFFNLDFNYCPLVWLFYSRSIDSKINRLHERVLRIVYNDIRSSIENILEKDGLSQYMEKIFKNLQQKCLRYRKTFLYL